MNKKSSFILQFFIFVAYGHGTCPSDMVLVKGGKFTMGCTAEQGSDCFGDESPAHSVTVADFCIGKWEVTQKQWKEIMGSNPSSFKNCGDDCPVENISWNDAQEFVKKLNLQTGKNYRLPTEAEWEYAARGGSQSKNYKYSGSDNLFNVAWYNGNSGSRIHSVGIKQPNDLGIYDMSGNVREWVNDWYDSYGSGSQKNPVGPRNGSNRILRGGSWYYDALGCRVSDRGYSSPGTRHNYSGFRLAMPLLPKTESK